MSKHRGRALLALLALSGALSARADNPPAPPPGPAPEAAPPPGSAPQAQGAPAPGPAGAPGSEAQAPDLTPPRLSFTDGEVSFWRSGAEDWTPAQTNVPLSEGDQLYTGDKANLEVQIGARAFLRAGEDTQLGLSAVEPDFIQLRIVSGHASLDLRSVKAGTTVEVDTPHAAFSIEHPGYYRLEVTDENTSFTSRRGGRATVTPANGNSAPVAASEQVVVSGTDQPQLETYAAPELDDWDRWNYTRTDQLIDAVSSRYVPYGEYGVDDLDHYGDWRVVPSYGAVWVPRVAPGWVPYSTGSWVYDPYYGWSWVDVAPWGWAPFHYGRWVQVGAYWGWAPGPLVAHPYYAPALVAFFNGPSFSIGVSFGHASTGWVALGWGEPCVPWWGPHGFRGSPHWVGWGGPRVVNNVVINKTTIVNVNEVHGWANAAHPGAVVGVPHGEFGHGVVHVQHFDAAKFAKFEPMHGNLEALKPTAASLTPTTQHAERPPRSFVDRSVVATRAPRAQHSFDFGRNRPPAREESAKPSRPTARAPENMKTAPEQVRVVNRDRRTDTLQNRPPFGRQSEAERESPPQPPRYRELHAEPNAEGRGAAPGAPAPPAPRGRAQASETPRPNRGQSHGSAPSAPRELPGEPANRVYRGHQAAPSRAPAVPAAPAHSAPSGGGHHGGGGGQQHGRPQHQ